MTDITILSLLTVLAMQMLGAYDHWRVMKKDGRITGSFIVDYLFTDYPGKSAKTISILIVSAWVSATTGFADNVNPELLINMVASGKLNVEYVTKFAGVVMASWGTGYAVDSRWNEGWKP